MTAEIVVMNRIAIAMAADTLISVRQVSSTSDSGAVKAYNGARKLMALHSEAAVGAMFFDSPDFHGMPWEVIFGEFFRDFHDEFPHVRDYADAFLRFLEVRSPDWTRPADMDGLVRDILIGPISALAGRWAVEADSVPIRQKDAAANAFVATWTAERQAAMVAGSARSTLTTAQLAESTDSATALITRVAPSLWRRLRAAARQQLVEQMLAELGRIGSFEKDRTGLVFAGFGKSQLLPSAHMYTVSGRLPGGVRFTEPATWELGDGRPAVVLPVAQDYMVQAFMTGIHPDIRERVSVMLESLVGQIPGADAANMLDRLNARLDEETHKLSQPVLEGLAFLSARDVAKLAKSLVALTARRNQVSLQPDTVGGPFDVALISRAEGFTWHERARGTYANRSATRTIRS